MLLCTGVSCTVLAYLWQEHTSNHLAAAHFHQANTRSNQEWGVGGCSSHGIATSMTLDP
jgi:hypothetical protein